jgi:hypothetical protein
MRQDSPAEAKKFTIGSSDPATGVGERQEKVGEAKRRLADKIRKEKWDIMIAEMSKSLVSTTTRKKGRREEGEWQTEILTKESRGTPSGTPRTPRQPSQSGIGSFLVPLHVEQREKILESRSLSNTKKIVGRSASPKLKPRRKITKQAIKLTMDQLKLVKMTKKEGPITTKNFGETESAHKAGQKPEQSGNKDNNNTVSTHLSGTTELRTSPPGQRLC